MRARRSKVVPDAILYPERTAALRSATPPKTAVAAPPAHASPALAPVELLSPGLNVYRTGGSSGAATAIPPRTTVLVADHVTNTGAVVRLEQVEYSKAMRAYRVCRQEGGSAAEEGAASGGHPGSTTAPSSAGSAPALTSSPCAAASTGHAAAPWRVVFLRLFGAADMLLLAITVACCVVLVSRLRGAAGVPRADVYGTGVAVSGAPPSLSWVALAWSALTTRRGDAGIDGVQAPVAAAAAAAGSPVAAMTAADAEAAPSASYTQATSAPALDFSMTCVVLFISTLLLAQRLSGAVGRVYVEEVLVMRGVGLQFSAYGIFNTLRYRLFVDLHMLRSLVIHDAFFRYQPMFFLSSSVENQAARVVYFPDTLPRLAVLRPVLNGIRGVLYGDPEEGPSLAELEERWKTSAGDLSEGDLFTDDSFAEDTATTPDDARSSDATDHDDY